MLYDSFPRYAPDARWRPLASRQTIQPIPAGVSAWLRDQGSLTRRVLRYCSGEFCVQVRFQGWAKALPSERRALDLQPAAACMLREVTLRCAGEAWIFARTLIPATTLQGAGRRLAYLGSRPLGEILFSDPDVIRDHMEVAKLLPDHVLFRSAVRDLDPVPPCLWARRTLFHLERRPLLVNEVFLPDLPET